MYRKVVWFYSFNSIISSHRTDCHGTNNWTRIPKWFTINIKKLLACTQEWNSSNMWVMKAYQNTYYNLWFGMQLGRHILISPCYLAFITEMSLWDTVFTHKTSLTPPGCETNWQSLVTYKVSAAHISIEQLILVSLTFSLLIQIIINITGKFVLHIDNKRLISNGQHYNQTHR